MKLEINSTYSEHGEIFQYKLYDGPDGICKYTGETTSLGEVFEQVISHRIKTSFDLF